MSDKNLFLFPYDPHYIRNYWAVQGVVVDMDTKQVASLIQQGEEANLRLGEVFHQYAVAKRNLSGLEGDLLNEHGMTLPSSARRSVMKGAFQSWVLSAGFSIDRPYYDPDFTDESGNQIPMRLSGVTIDKLYHLKEIVKDPNLEEHERVQWLRFAYEHSEKQCRDAKHAYNKARNSGEEPTTAEAAQENVSSHKSLVIEEGLYEQLMEFVDRLRRVTQDSGLSRSVALEFMLSQFHDSEMNDETLLFLWKGAHGELTEEEIAEREEMELEIVD